MCAIFCKAEKQHALFLDTLANAAKAKKNSAQDLYPKTRMLHSWKSGSALLLAQSGRI
jgi:hypothetical protein